MTLNQPKPPNAPCCGHTAARAKVSAGTLTAKGRTAILRMLDAHEQMLAAFGPAELTDALLTVMERRARGQVHRIEKVAA